MKLAIFGLARSGISALKHIASLGHEVHAVNKGAPEGWEKIEDVLKLIPRSQCHDEDVALEVFGASDIIVKSPGIPYTHPALAKARSNRVEIISEIEYAYRCSDIPVVAITGTNGKTTTAIMTSELLKGLGLKVFLGGNIGHPYSEVLLDKNKYDVAVIEVSSFQLENIVKFRPKVAVLTNISPSHAERYESHELYRDAKLKLFQNMGEGDLALLHPDLFDLNLPFPKEKIEQFDLDYSRSKVQGRHNLMNLACAIKAAIGLGLKEKEVMAVAQDYIEEYEGASFRMQHIRDWEGLKIINDGKSTNMASTLAALESYEPSSTYLVLGGKLRSEDMDLESLVGLGLKQVYAFGEAANFISKKLSGKISVSEFPDLVSVFEEVKMKGPKGTLLFSPAFPSFDLYRNYEERGEHFNKLARAL